MPEFQGDVITGVTLSNIQALGQMKNPYQ